MLRHSSVADALLAMLQASCTKVLINMHYNSCPKYLGSCEMREIVYSVHVVLLLLLNSIPM